MEWFLVQILSPLLLPIFIMIVLGLLCDVKPDPYIKIYLDIVQTVLVAIFKALVQVLKTVGIFLCRAAQCIFRCLSCAATGQSCCGDTPCTCDKKPAPDGPPKKKPPSKIELTREEIAARDARLKRRHRHRT